MRKYWKVEDDGTKTSITQHEYEMLTSRSYRIGYALGKVVPGLFIGGALGALVILADKALR